MSERNWRKRYERQIQANNLLNDRLRDERKEQGRRETRLLKHIRTLNEDNKSMLTDTMILKSVLLENGINDPTITVPEEDKVSDAEGGEAGSPEVLEEEKE